jgi:hypothetical protein
MRNEGDCSRSGMIPGCHEGHPPRRRKGHAAQAAHAPHAEAHRPDLQPPVPALSDRPAQAGPRAQRGDPQPQLSTAPHRGRLRRRPRRRTAHPLSGRAAAARHRRRDQVRRAAPRRTGHRLQRRRADRDRPERRAGAAPLAQGQGDHRADAGREPVRLRPGGDRAGRRRAALPGEAQAGRDHHQQHQRRHLRPRAGHLRPHPQGHAATSRRWSSAARPSSPMSTRATGSTSGRRRNTRRCTATS